MLVRIGIVAKIQGVSTSTLRRWEKEEKFLPERRTRGGHRRYKLVQALNGENGRGERKQKKTVFGYARVSATKQRKELQKQKEQLQKFAKQQGWKMTTIYSDIASGMNEQRKGLQRLLNEVATTHPFAIICTYEDRLARFGTKVIKHYCQTFSTNIITMHRQLQTTKEEKLVEDMIALITSFAGRLHRQRRGKAPPS
ncbi:MAG: IS607 family transposase [Candidatus Heimdallarchaeaceae archaeon]